MTARSTRFGFQGQNRSLGYGQGKKVAVGAITSAYRVDTHTMADDELMYQQNGQKGFMSRPAEGAFWPRKGEVAFTVVGSGGRVRTTLNGLDAPLAAIYPNDPELVRQLLYEMVQPIGFVEEDAETGKTDPLVTLRIGGTHPCGAPGTYNFGESGELGERGKKVPHIIAGSMVVFDIPNLKNPIQFGNPASGVVAGKVMLVPRALDKRSAATRIVTLVGALNRNPDKFKAALRDAQQVVHTWVSTAKKINRSYKTAALLGVETLLRKGVLQINPALAEFKQPGAAGAPLAIEDAIVRMAEYLDLVSVSSTAAAALTPAARSTWREVEFEIRNRMLATPDPQTNAVNAAYQFGFVVDAVNGTYSSKARVNGNGAIRDDSMGKFFKLTITHFQELLEAVTAAVYHERKNALGVALTEPTLNETSEFQMYVQPHGGMTDKY